MLATVQSSGWVADYPMPAIAVGLGLLVVGADLLVRGAVWIALVLGMSRMAVGLTLVAMGTSMPEFMVSFTAARTGHNAIAMANVIGSNTANVLLIVGIAAAIRAIHLRVGRLELTYLLLATALAGLPFVLGGQLTHLLAGLMVAMLVAFCWQLLRRERRSSAMPKEPGPRGSLLGWLLHLGAFAAGLAALVYASEWLVIGSARVALSLGMSEAMVGMTIVAIGTSLPELATSAVAARRGQPEIAIGNVIGSCIFNVGAVLGIAGVLQPFPVDTHALWRLMVATAVSAIALVLVLGVRLGVSRRVGWAFVAAYGAFLAGEVVLSTRG